ncbi:MarR family winged helix-turn-helix transcriptional regulator [soil metagenome]
MSERGAIMPGDIEDPLRLDRQVCFPLYAASNLLTRLYRPVLAELGLTYSQYLVMLVLWEHSPQTVGSLGERLHLDSGTLTPLLKRMEAAGLLSRQRDPDDERRVRIALTDQGGSLRDRASNVPATLASGLDLSSTDLESLREAVQNMVAVLASHRSVQDQPEP